MNDFQYKYIKYFIAMLFLLGLGYLIKLFFDGVYGIYLFGLIVGLYGILIVVITAIMDKKLFNEEYGYVKIDDSFEPKTLIEKLKAMHPKDFEDFVMLLFELRGYKIIYKSFWRKHFSSRIPQKDGGIDLIATRDNKKVYVQIKKKNTDMVSVEIMRAFYGSIFNKLKGDDRGLFVTTSIFSDDAEKYAKENHIDMISYKELEKEIAGLEKEVKIRQKIENFLSQIDYYQNRKYNQNIRTCPKCGGSLKWRKEGFYGCQNYFKTGCDYKAYK